MAAVLKQILGEEGLKEWEEGRESRLSQYDERRE